jgi:hypothetical protein
MYMNSESPLSIQFQVVKWPCRIYIGSSQKGKLEQIDCRRAYRIVIRTGQDCTLLPIRSKPQLKEVSILGVRFTLFDTLRISRSLNSMKDPHWDSPDRNSAHSNQEHHSALAEMGWKQMAHMIAAQRTEYEK